MKMHCNGPNGGWDTYSAAYAALRKGAGKIGIRLHQRWQGYGSQIDQARIKRQLELNLNRYRSNLVAIIEMARNRGIPLVLIKQVITTPRGIANRKTTGGYEEEYRAVANELDSTGQIRGSEITLYVHHELMAEVEALAREYDLPLVDNIKLVDAAPEGLLTQVHLSEEANARLAEAIYQTIHSRGLAP